MLPHFFTLILFALLLQPPCHGAGGPLVRRIPLGVVPRLQTSYEKAVDTFQVLGGASPPAMPGGPSQSLNLLVLIGVTVGGSPPQALSLLLQINYPDMAIFDCVGVAARGLSFSPAGAVDPLVNHTLSHCVRAESLGRSGASEPRYSDSESQYSCDDQGSAMLSIQGLGSASYPMPYRLCRVYQPYPSYNNTDGYFGLGNSDAGQIPRAALPFLDTVINGTQEGSLGADAEWNAAPLVVVVRVDPPWVGPSTLVVGLGAGVFDLPELAGVAWSGPQPTRAAADHDFFMYDLSLCGVGLLANYSGGWAAEVSLALGCIGLPGEFFDMVKAHVPTECAPMLPSSGSTGGFTERCVLPQGTPPLTFRLEQDRAVQVHRLRLGGQCIQRHRISAKSAFPPPILIGAPSLADMDVALDYSKRRVGLIARPGREVGPGDPSLCTAPPICSKGASLYLPMNRCIPEPCASSGSAVTELYARSGRCEPSKAAQVLLGFAIAIFFMMELALAESHHRFKQNIIRQFPVCTALRARS